MPTTIQVSEKLKRRLARQKEHPRQTYEEVIQRALDLLEEDELELSPEFQRKVRLARRQARTGKSYTTEEILRELGL